MASNQTPDLTPRTSTLPPAGPLSHDRPVVCVFCGASPGTTPAHLAAARSLGHALHKANAFLVYGGGTRGLMGEVARTLVALSGPSAVHGIIPQALLKHEQTTDAQNEEKYKLFGQMTVVENMHERKKQMADRVYAGGPGSGFVALSGGFGTMEEVMEVTTWNQLGMHGRGIVLYSVDGFYDGLLQWIETAMGAGFITPANAGIMKHATTGEEVMELLAEYEPSKDRLALSWSQT